jgi:hypothetical protein
MVSIVREASSESTRYIDRRGRCGRDLAHFVRTIDAIPTGHLVTELRSFRARDEATECTPSAAHDRPAL